VTVTDCYIRGTGRHYSSPPRHRNIDMVMDTLSRERLQSGYYLE
jgi:hypothetical protein